MASKKKVLVVKVDVRKKKPETQNYHAFLAKDNKGLIININEKNGSKSVLLNKNDYPNVEEIRLQINR